MNNQNQRSTWAVTKGRIADSIEPSCRDLTDTEISAAARHLADLEEKLWRTILGNPAKLRFLVVCIHKQLKDNRRYEVSKELHALMKLLTRSGKPGAAKIETNDSIYDLAAMILKIDIDREIVIAVGNEAIRRGTRKLANGKFKLSAHAKTVRETMVRIELSKNAFIEANQGLVVAIANKFKERGMPFLDRVQEGNLGLIKAVNRFDYRLGYKFSTYASWWIRAAIGRAIDSKESMIRVPGSTIRNQSQLKRASREIWLRTGRRPTDEEIAEEAGMGDLKLSRTRRHFVSTVFSLDEEIPGSGNLRYIDALPDDTAKNPLEEMQRQAMFEEIGILLGSLTPLEQSIIKQRFGLGDKEKATLREIGEQYDLSRERIRQIQNKALEKLREGMARNAA